MHEKRTTGKHLAPVADAAPAFTKTEARKFTDSIRADVQALWAKVLEAHDRKAWAALGYDSFRDYMREEFDHDRELLVTTWKEVVEQHGPDPAGWQVRHVVRAKVDERKRPEERLGDRLQRLDRCLGSVDLHANDLAYILDDQCWSVGDGSFFDAPDAIRDRWIEEAEAAKVAIARVLRRLKSDIPTECLTCRGTGTVLVDDDTFSVCPACHGPGWVPAR
jgi:hypothetical protein